MILGKIGLTCNFDWNEPRDKFNPDDLKASEIANQFWEHIVHNTFIKIRTTYFKFPGIL
jgi:hypothetical protein